MRKYFLQYITNSTTDGGARCYTHWQQRWHTQKLKILQFQNFKTTLKNVKM